MRRSAASAVLVAVAFAMGCGGPAKKNAKTSQEAVGVPVQAARAELGALVEQVPVTGTISALRRADVTAQVSGRVTEVTVREGDVVEAGQVMVRLDRRELESQLRQAQAGVVAARARLGAARKRAEITQLGARSEERSMAASRLEQAEAALRQAAADRDRMQKLYQDGAVSKQEVDAAQTAYDTARTNRDSARDSLALTEKGARPEEIEAAKKDVEAAEAALEQALGALAQTQQLVTYTVIRSPLSGVVYERNVEPGEIAMPGGSTPLLRVADPSSVYLEATVPERLARQVEVGQRVQVTLQATGGRALEGEVQRVVPVADPKSRDFLLRVSLTSKEAGLRPGVFAQAKILVQEHKGVVVIPKDALVNRGGGFVAFVVEGGKAVERPVQVGLTDATRAEIVSGVRPGESVVAVGGQALKNGDRVQLATGGG
jgi:RND family efflux transporter MFP subunit